MTASDQWDEGAAYDPYVGRWSRLVASRFVEWLAPVPGGRWADVGCGTGALTEAILGGAEPAFVLGIDPSEGYLGLARARIPDARVHLAVGSAAQLPDDGGPYNFAVSGLVLNFVPDPAEGLSEMRRVTRPGGCVAAYVWDYSDGMEMMRFFWDAATELDPDAAALDEGVRFPMCKPGPLRSLWERSGLHDLAVIPIEIDTPFRDFDDYWTPFLGGQGPAPSYTLSLGEAARERLKDYLCRRLPAQEDGSIRLRARAWAVRGRA